MQLDIPLYLSVLAKGCLFPSCTIHRPIHYFGAVLIHRKTLYHPSKFPKPTFRFFFPSSGSPGSTTASVADLFVGGFTLRYFPTPPPALPPTALLSVPNLSPNQLISSSFFSLFALSGRIPAAAAACFARFFCCRVLYSSNGSWKLMEQIISAKGIV